MKVLFLVKRFYPSIGGVEKHAFEVAKELADRGDEITIVTEENSIDSKLNFDNHKLRAKIYRIPAGESEKLKKFRIWKWFWKNRQLIKEAEIIHCHDVFYWYLPFRFLFPNKPVFITFHGWEGKFPIPQKNLFMRKIGEKLSNGNICIGEYLKKWYGTKTDFISYGGVRLEKEKSNRKEENKIVFVGRLEKDTGLPIYLKLLKILKKKKVNFVIEFYGDGSLRKEAEKYGKVFGFTDNAYSKISSAGIVFASSYLAILEALSLKKAVISVYDNPLKRDYLFDSPFKNYLVLNSNPVKLAEETISLLKTDKENLKGYDWARKQSWEKVTDLYLKLWGRNT
ncbi:MAG: Glycosyl transferases group 1 [Microgenomates group bacterium ADurb.Bin219]|nr:MAG: Glycosyl transferases group 1 [Microgenomates group bacterium ADurb.Bin219]